MYPKSSGLDKAMRQRIIEYLVQRHGLTKQEAEDARERYVRLYGLSLPGIMLDFTVDVADYQDFIHGVDIRSYIKPDPVLNDMLAKVNTNKAIFTNSSHDHVTRVLDALGVDSSLFSHVVDFRSTGFKAKPLAVSFDAMLGIIGAEGKDCLIVDDMYKTISIAKREYGMSTAFVDEDCGASGEDADWHVRTINDLAMVLTEFGSHD